MSSCKMFKTAVPQMGETAIFIEKVALDKCTADAVKKQADRLLGIWKHTLGRPVPIGDFQTLVSEFEGFYKKFG